MNRVRYTLACLIAAAFVFVQAASANEIPIGYISYDVTGTNVAQFDIVNQTGPNSSTLPDTTFPVTTLVQLQSLGLTISFPSAASIVEPSSYFTLDADGESQDGTPLSTATDPPSGIDGATSATVTGSFSVTTFTLNDGTTVTVDPTFSATITDLGGLQDGDFAVIDATVASGGGGGPVVPEPGSIFLLGTGMAGLISMRSRRLVTRLRDSFGTAKAAVLPALLVIGLAFFATQNAQAAGEFTVHLNVSTVPGASTGGSSVTLAGVDFPPAPIAAASVVVNFSATCGGAVLATENPSKVTSIIGTSERLSLTVPVSLKTGTYYISISGTSEADVAFISGNCATIQITNTSSTLAACLPSSSLAVLTGKNVTAYIPNGSWDYGTTGISVVPVEGAGTATSLPTAGRVNSCSSNSETGETVCVDGNTDVYLLTGSTITNTLTSGATKLAGFSGGECENCGVAIDALTNTAVIAGGFGTSSGDGIQLLNLSNNTFAAPFGSVVSVSENVSVDPNRNLILSPDEEDYYDIFEIAPSGAITEYLNYQPVGGEFDSAAEDCTTGIALSTQEFTNNLFIADLTQATFTAPTGGVTYGTWTAPSQSVNLYPSGDFNFSAGTSGISVAPGTTHLGITEGEFGGNTFAAFQLPATSGTGTPNFVDYVGASLPATPDGVAFSAGTDPHTITAYTSPNNGKAYGLVAGWNDGGFGQPVWLAVIDLQALLNASRSATDAHLVNASVNLLTSGIVRYIAVP